MLRPYYSFLIVPQTKKALHPQVKGRCPSVQITLDVFCVISLDLISPETSTCSRRTSSTTFILAISAAAFSSHPGKGKISFRVFKCLSFLHTLCFHRYLCFTIYKKLSDLIKFPGLSVKGMN